MIKYIPVTKAEKLLEKTNHVFSTIFLTSDKPQNELDTIHTQLVGRILKVIKKEKK